MIRHLYVHIPFCPKICPYCSFYKEASDHNKTQAFLDSLLLELDLRIQQGMQLQPHTIFFGGGTPSALSIHQLDFLLTGLHQRLDLSQLREWTLEMNPATVSTDKAKLLRQFEINRISMGVQSWDPETLVTLGRIHSDTQALKSYEILRQAEFPKVNLDLIFGVPGQSPQSWLQSLRKTIRLQPDHISSYCLTYEEDTEFFLKLQRGEFAQNHDADAELFEATMDTLESAGFLQYEISNYAPDGNECLHNLAYWFGYDYLGLGPSAFSTVAGSRWQNAPDTTTYINSLQLQAFPITFQETLSRDVSRAEKIAFSIRTRFGISLENFSLPSSSIENLLEENFVLNRNNHLLLTRKGKLLADEIAETLMDLP